MTLAKSVQIHTSNQLGELCNVLLALRFDSTVRIFNDMNYTVVVRSREKIVEIDSTGKSTTYLRRQ